ncbi:hypothetical protein GOP47_0008278 [Adiantum capillus-veneris]|uniref:Uncharacterized protein n=1 Tax=Adiantum capillus-veneris TaxID=13818 RepID=A0A9D4UY93_ADICA|nr:hypothetical protein GOP47_0008278 [Adiantum capillus-veneris]
MVPGYEAMPSWNDIYDDHVLYSLGIAATCMDDGGWTLVMCSTSSLPIVERMVSKVWMEVHLRWLAKTTEPYAYTGKSDFVVKENAFHEKSSNKVWTLISLKHFLPSSQRSKQAGNIGSCLEQGRDQF